MNSDIIQTPLIKKSMETLQGVDFNLLQQQTEDYRAPEPYTKINFNKLYGLSSLDHKRNLSYQNNIQS